MRPTVVFDAGAFIGFERGLSLVRQYVVLATRAEVDIATSAAVIAQVWRGGARQARLARLLRSELLEEVPLDADASRRIGAMAAVTRAKDVVDGHVAAIALERDAVLLTSDVDDLLLWGVTAERVIRC